MNKTTTEVFFTFSFTLLTTICCAQGSVMKTESNGVVYHQSAGVEVLEFVSTETSFKEKVTEEWSLDQLKEMVDHISLKLVEVANTERAMYYQEQLILIQDRIKELESNKQIKKH